MSGGNISLHIVTPLSVLRWTFVPNILLYFFSLSYKIQRENYDTKSHSLSKTFGSESGLIFPKNFNVIIFIHK